MEYYAEWRIVICSYERDLIVHVSFCAAGVKGDGDEHDGDDNDSIPNKIYVICMRISESTYNCNETKTGSTTLFLNA